MIIKNEIWEIKKSKNQKIKKSKNQKIKKSKNQKIHFQQLDQLNSKSDYIIYNII